MSQIELQKYFALLEEFETSHKLILHGFGALQSINISNDFYFLPFQLISQGFERFMKAYLCVAYFEKNKKLPDYKYLKKLGHDLEALLNEITNEYYKHYKPIQFEEDFTFLTTDRDLKELLAILSSFGKLSRYYNFDLITGNQKIGINTTKAWKAFENRIAPMNNERAEKLFNPFLSNEIYGEISLYIVVVFEKFLSALSRQIVFRTLGQNGIQLTSCTFFDFGLLYPKEFGKKDYRKNNSKYKQISLKVYKRTWKDEIERKTNKNFKHKKITKKEFDGDWPFYFDEVIIECRNKHWCIVSIDGYDYALNGAAQGKYKLENPHDAGMAILGKSIGEFIEMALDLK